MLEMIHTLIRNINAEFLLSMQMGESIVGVIER